MNRRIAAAALTLTSAAVLTACGSAGNEFPHGATVLYKEHVPAAWRNHMVPVYTKTCRKVQVTKTKTEDRCTNKKTGERFDRLQVQYESWQVDVKMPDGSIKPDVSVTREQFDDLEIGHVF